MRDFDDELRDGLGRTAGDAPLPRGIPEGVLRRARRRRAANATLTGVLAAGVALGGFLGVRAAMDSAAPVSDTRPADAGPVAGPSPSPTPPGTPGPSPEPTADPEPVRSICESTEGGNDRFHPDFVAVSHEPGSVTFHLVPMEGQTDPPRYFISFTEKLLTDGEGAPVDVRGETFVAVSFFARGVELAGEEVVEIYTGPKEIVVDGPIVQELEQTGDFEGMVSWGIGLSERTCYTVDAGPDHLTITFE